MCFVFNIAFRILSFIVKFSIKTRLILIPIGYLMESAAEKDFIKAQAGLVPLWYPIADKIVEYLCVIGFFSGIINWILSKILRRPVHIWKDLFYAITGHSWNLGKLNKGYYSKLKNSYKAPQGVVIAEKRISPKKYVCIPDSEIAHESIIGGTGSGKTVNILATVLNKKNNYSMLILDGKDGGEIRKKSESARKKLHQIVKFFDPDNENTFKFNPYEQFEYISEEDYTDVADRMAVNMIEKSPQEKNSMWVDNARILLSGIILYNVILRNDFKKTMEFIQLHGVKEQIEIIKSAYNSDNDKFKQAYKKIAFLDGMADETLTGINSNMMSKLSCFSSERVLNALSGDGEYISPSDLEHNTTIYFNVELAKAQDHWKAEWNLCLNLVFYYFAKRGKELASSGAKPKKILFILDEFVNYGKINKIENQISLVRSAGVSIMLAFQSVAQIDNIYGKDVRKIILDNMSYQLILKINDEETARTYSNMSGTYDKKRMSKSSNDNQNAYGFHQGMGNGINESYEEKNIVKPEDFKYLPDKNECIVFMPDGIARLKKVLYYHDINYKL